MDPGLLQAFEPDMEGAMFASNQDPEDIPPAVCTCITDPFADLPPELRPRPKPHMGNLRQVTCPGCRLNYWTNRSTDLCPDCQKKGVTPLDPDKPEPNGVKQPIKDEGRKTKDQ